MAEKREEPRAARTEPRTARKSSTGPRASGNDDAQIASEPMDLQRLPDDGGTPAPPGRQRTGDPPAR